MLIYIGLELLLGLGLDLDHMVMQSASHRIGIKARTILLFENHYFFRFNNNRYKELLNFSCCIILVILIDAQCPNNKTVSVCDILVLVYKKYKKANLPEIYFTRNK